MSSGVVCSLRAVLSWVEILGGTTCTCRVGSHMYSTAATAALAEASPPPARVPCIAVGSSSARWGSPEAQNHGLKAEKQQQTK